MTTTKASDSIFASPNNRLVFTNQPLTSWREIVEWVDFLIHDSWVFRGHERAEWDLKTSLEREFAFRGDLVEPRVLERFVRTAPRLLPSHLIPDDTDVAAWLGLIQHYGGPTRLLDVTRSPYIALFVAFEPAGNHDRAVWAIDHHWCMSECAHIMATGEGTSPDDMRGRLLFEQRELVSCLVHGWDAEHGSPQFESFKHFTGVFPLDPWKPDIRQSAQQALFLCAANAHVSFVENLAAHERPHDDSVPPEEKVLYRFVLPAALREEALEQLAAMNVTAATLFPDLGGLARSLRTYPVARPLRSRRAPSK